MDFDIMHPHIKFCIPKFYRKKWFIIIFGSPVNQWKKLIGRIGINSNGDAFSFITLVYLK